MSRLSQYADRYANAKLTRSDTGVLEVAFHTDGGKLVFNGYTHEQSGSSTWARTRDLRITTSVAAIQASSNESPHMGRLCGVPWGRRMNGLTWVPVQDHVELQSADHKWQKWEMREGEGPANREGSTSFTSGLHACPLWTHPLKENPLFPT